MIFCNIVVEIHHLHNEIDTLCWAIGRLWRKNILFAQDGGLTVDEKAGSAIAIAQHDRADDNAFARL